MRVLDNIQERFTASLDGAFAAYDERVAAGTQPSTPGATPGFLIFANAGYVLVTAALYFAMQRREKGFEIKGIITVYNLSCVIAAGYCAVHIILYKYQHPGSLACNALVEKITLSCGTRPMRERSAPRSASRTGTPSIATVPPWVS